MRKTSVVALIAATLLAGCAHKEMAPATPGEAPVPIESDSITYETGPCFGACPVYSVTVRPDGSGVFDGKRFTAVSGERSFTLTPEQYAKFAAAVAPYRPESGEVRYEMGGKNCQMAATDMPSVDVRWTRAIGDSQALHFYYGCRDAANRALADALGNAPDVLPIAEFVGEQP